MSYNGQSTVPPSNITFTNLNFITNTVVSTIGNNQVLWVPPASGDNMVGQYVAAPATPYCCIANIVPSMGASYQAQVAEAWVYGLGFYDGTKLVWISQYQQNPIAKIFECANVSTVSSIVYPITYANLSQPSNNWFQVRDDGTSIYFYVAMDGDSYTPPTVWYLLYKQARGSYLSAPTNICWLTDSNSSANNFATLLTLRSWQTVAL